MTRTKPQIENSAQEQAVSDQIKDFIMIPKHVLKAQEEWKANLLERGRAAADAVATRQRKFDPDPGGITTEEYAKQHGLTRDAAKNRLNRLVEKGRFTKKIFSHSHGGTVAHYYPV